MTKREKRRTCPLDPQWWLSGGPSCLSPEQKGGLSNLLAHAWLAELPCILPDDDGALARLSGLGGAKWRKTGAAIRAQFELVDGGLRNPQQWTEYCRVRTVADARAMAGQLGGAQKASKRVANGKQTGSKPLANVKQTCSKRVAIATDLLAGPSPSPPGPPQTPPITPPPSPFRASHDEATKPPSPDPRIRAFILWFSEQFPLYRHGATYFVQWKRDAPLVKQLLTTYPPERLQRLAKLLWKTDDEWIAGTDRGIGILSNRISWLDSKLAEYAATRRTSQAG